MAYWQQSVAQKNSLAFSILEWDKQLNVEFPVPMPAMVALVAIEAGCIVAEAVKLITGLQLPALAGKLKMYNFDDISTLESWQKQPDCSVCSMR